MPILIQPIHELKTSFNMYKWLREKNQINNNDTWKWYEIHVGIHKYRFVGAQPCPFFHILSMAASCYQGRVQYLWQRPDRIAKLKILTIWPFIGKKTTAEPGPRETLIHVCKEDVQECSLGFCFIRKKLEAMWMFIKKWLHKSILVYLYNEI